MSHRNTELNISNPNSSITKSTARIFPILVNSFPPRHPSQNPQDSSLVPPFPFPHTRTEVTSLCPSRNLPQICFLLYPYCLFPSIGPSFTWMTEIALLIEVPDFRTQFLYPSPSATKIISLKYLTMIPLNKILWSLRANKMKFQCLVWHLRTFTRGPPSLPLPTLQSF